MGWSGFNMDNRIVCFLAGTLLIISVCVVTADEHEYKLVRDIMRDYDPRIRPSKNASESLNVTFGLALAQIIDVDEKNQIITTNCWLNQAWIDYKLQWDPAKYGGIKVVRLPFDAIWKPDILLYNNADVSAYKSSISTNVMVSNDGNVTWLSMMIFRSSCAIDVKFFPFDEQNCSMLFASWTYDGFQVNLQKVGEVGDVSNYIPNSEWTLVKLHVIRNVVTYSCCDEPYPDVTYYIQIRRKPLFYVFNMILPCMLITMVALLGFYIPSDSGEKVTMGITTLLSMTVFLMLVAENMPPTSDALPLMGLYYGITIAIVSFATAMTVLTLNIHHKGVRGREVPKFIKVICFGILARLMCLRLEHPEPPDSTTTFTGENGEPSHGSSKKQYMKLKQSNRGSNRSMESSTSRMTVLDFVPGKDLNSLRERFEMCERLPENGGISPRFSQNRHPPASCPSSNLSAGPGEPCFEKQFVRVLQKVYQTIEKNEIRLAEQDRRDHIKLEWQQVALVIDRLLLWIFIITTVGVTLGIMLHAPHSVRFFGGYKDNN